MRNKIHRSSYPPNSSRSSKVGELIYADLARRMGIRHYLAILKMNLACSHAIQSDRTAAQFVNVGHIPRNWRWIDSNKKCICRARRHRNRPVSLAIYLLGEYTNTKFGVNFRIVNLSMRFIYVRTTWATWQVASRRIACLVLSPHTHAHIHSHPSRSHERSKWLPQCCQTNNAASGKFW